MGDPLPAFRAIARSARKRILARVAAMRNKSQALAIVRKELAEIEPLLARTLRDGQILAWLTAGQTAARQRQRPVAEAIKPTEAAEISEFRKPEIPSKAPLGVTFDVESGRNRLPPSPPSRILFPDQPDDPPPVVRLPQVERAARYLQTRLAYTPDEFRELDDDARSVAFTVAKAQTLNAVEHVQRALADDVERGGTLKAFKATVREALDRSAVSDAQVEALYRTHTARAYSAGQIDVLDHPLVADEFPYLLYDYTHDSRVRPEHVWLGKHGLNGTGIRRRDDPFWKLWFPPCGWNCRCVAIPLSLEDAAAHGVREAREWLRTGIPPARPEWCEVPPFKLPKGWVPVGDRLQTAI